MSLKNVLIIVDNIDESINFYEELFGLRVVTRLEGNVIMSDGLRYPSARSTWSFGSAPICGKLFRRLHLSRSSIANRFPISLSCACLAI